MTVLLALSAPSLAATLTVDPSDKTAYSAIQDAIDDASDGDTIEVVAGTFVECIDTSGKDLTLTGAGSGSTTLNGLGACTSVVSVQSGETVTLSGFEIRNASYRGLYLLDSTVTLTDLEVSGNGSTSLYGGGLYIEGGVVAIADSELSGNTAYHGGNLYITGAAEVSLTDTEVSDGWGYYGGGIFLLFDSGDGASSLSISGGEVATNTAYYYGAGLYADEYSEVTSDSVSWYSNYGTYTYGAGAYIGEGGSLSSTDDDWTYNTSSYSGTPAATTAARSTAAPARRSTCWAAPCRTTAATTAARSTSHRAP